jgi:hypothetical protein
MGLFDCRAQPDNRRTILGFSTGNRLSSAWLRTWPPFGADGGGEAFQAICGLGKESPSPTCRTRRAIKIIGSTTSRSPRMGCVGLSSPGTPGWLEVMPNAGHYPMDDAGRACDLDQRF